MKGLYFLVFIGLLLGSSCNNHNQDVALAKVGKKYLYTSDLKGIISPGTSLGDSAIIAKKYIDFWVEQQIMARYADKELSSKEKDFDQQIENYKQTLLIQALETSYISKHLDTAISEKEINTYYKNHEAEFELKSNIIRLNFAKFHRGSPSIDKVKRLLFSPSQNKKLISSICGNEAENYFLDDKVWLLFDDIIKEIPIQNYNEAQFLQNNKTIETTDSTYHYLIVIKDFKIKDAVSPLIYEIDNIRAIILNTRRNILLDKLHAEIKKNAVENSDFEIYQK